ncbi:MAG: NAD(P)/FAD-dependent oxidoreductase [Ignavibacteriales bacterium]|nr:NAD(P)/FAD-dependent oxidoreductase [Ignavibacteriales bacterium]
MKGTTTLILGGGFGGLAAAYTLRSLIPSDHRITMIDKSYSFHVGAAKTWVMLGDKTLEEVTRKRRQLTPQGVEFVEAKVEAINLALGEVQTTKGMLKGDFIIIGLGADVNMSAVPGLQEAAHTFYTLDGAVRLRQTLKDFSGGDVVFLIPRTPFKCPPAPYEAALLLQDLFNKRGIQGKAQIHFYTIEPLPMPTAGPETGAFVRGLLEDAGISYRPLHKVVRVDASEKRIHFENGNSTGYDLLIAVPPHESPRVVREAGLTNESGWVPVNPKTMAVSQGQASIPVYAVGDVTSVSLPGRFKPDVPLVLPKAGVFAASQGVVVARQIAGRITGEAASGEFEGKGFCYIETGGGKAVKGEGSFFDLPHPHMNRRDPDGVQYNDKVRWVHQWLEGSFSELLKE